VIPESGRGKLVMNLLNPNSLRVHFLESEAKNLALPASPAAASGARRLLPTTYCPLPAPVVPFRNEELPLTLFIFINIMAEVL
jgi:hypothetical protein